MKSINTRIIITIGFIGILIIFSGCISQQKENATGLIQPSPDVSSSRTPYQTYSIHIDPIRDYNTDSDFKITGSTKLTVKGTTDFPAGTVLHFTILEENQDRDVLRTNLEITGNSSGPNSFSYVYDMKGNPPGQYRVILADSINLNVGLSRFNITSNVPYYKWIRINPINGAHKGRNIPVSGTTDMPAGSEITLHCSVFIHPCIMSPPPDTGGKRTICGGSCPDKESIYTVHVLEGVSGVNTWNATVNITDICDENYYIRASATTWPNVTSGSQNIYFS